MSEQPRMPRFYGGHYDSVKQGAYRDFLVSQNITVWREELRRRYSARLKLDILLGANVVITDAQFYDGLFFHRLVASETQRRDFFTFLGEARERLDAPLIEVRRRQGGLLEMLGKRFIFSSLRSGQAKDEVFNAMVKVLEGTQGTAPYTDWKNLMQDVVGAIETNSAKEQMQEIIEAITLLNEAPTQIFRNWEQERVKAYPQFLKEAKRELGFKGFDPTGNEEVDETLRKVENEMEKDSPRRGDIEKWIRECKNADLADNYRTRTLDGVWNQVLQVYNLTIAHQHRCISIDKGETPISPKENLEIVAALSPATIGAIAEQSWTDLWKVLSSSDLGKSWVEWRDIICEPHRFNQFRILKTLVDLVGHIEKTYGHWSTSPIEMLVAGGSSTLTFSANGLSLDINPIKLVRGVVLGAKAAVSGATEGFNLIQHGLKILASGSKEG